ncbi:hypothetical protein U1Q18_003794 [Sarracenia purpurea var. burkii]
MEPMTMGDESDEWMEGSVSFFAPDSEDSEIAPEVVAWADSCLAKDPEISDRSWDTLKNALQEIAILQHDSFDFSAAGRESLPKDTHIGILPSSEKAQTSPNLIRTVADTIPSNKEVEQNSDDYIGYEKIDHDLNSRTKSGFPFMPHYSEDLKENQDTNSGLDIGFNGVAIEPATDDIFRVWDLDIPAVEDELIKQLTNVLAESPSRPLPSISNSSGKDLKEDSLADLIAAISDLSLNQNSR